MGILLQIIKIPTASLTKTKFVTTVLLIHTSIQRLKNVSQLIQSVNYRKSWIPVQVVTKVTSFTTFANVELFILKLQPK